MPRRPATVTQADVADDRQALVYFVRVGKFIKIGFTTNLAARLKAFEATVPLLQCLLTIPGDLALEKKLHHLLQDERVSRELFRTDGRIWHFIDVYKYFGLERALESLAKTTPHALAKKKEQDRLERLRVQRQTKAELDARYAALVADRKQRLGW